jgi:hypothetical protein
MIEPRTENLLSRISESYVHAKKKKNLLRKLLSPIVDLQLLSPAHPRLIIFFRGQISSFFEKQPETICFVFIRRLVQF